MSPPKDTGRVVKNGIAKVPKSRELDWIQQDWNAGHPGHQSYALTTEPLRLGIVGDKHVPCAVKYDNIRPSSIINRSPILTHNNLYTYI